MNSVSFCLSGNVFFFFFFHIHRIFNGTGEMFMILFSRERKYRIPLFSMYRKTGRQATESLSLGFWEEITDDTFPPILMLLSFKLSLINAYYFYHSEGPSSKINFFFPHCAKKLKNLSRHILIHSPCIV